MCTARLGAAVSARRFPGALQRSRLIGAFLGNGIALRDVPPRGALRAEDRSAPREPISTILLLSPRIFRVGPNMLAGHKRYPAGRSAVSVELLFHGPSNIGAQDDFEWPSIPGHPSP